MADLIISILNASASTKSSILEEAIAIDFQLVLPLLRPWRIPKPKLHTKDEPISTNTLVAFDARVPADLVQRLL
jgi:hypothetical protein